MRPEGPGRPVERAPREVSTFAGSGTTGTSLPAAAGRDAPASWIAPSGLVVVERGIAPEAVPGALAAAVREILDPDDIDALRTGPAFAGIDIAFVVRHATRREIGAAVLALGARGPIGEVHVHRLEPSARPLDVDLGGRS